MLLYSFIDPLRVVIQDFLIERQIFLFPNFNESFARNLIYIARLLREWERTPDATSRYRHTKLSLTYPPPITY